MVCVFASAGTAGAKDGDPLRAFPGNRRCFGVWGAGNGGNGLPSRIARAFFSFELLLVLFLFALASAAAVPMLYDWQEERELDLASEEVASAIREAQMLVKSGHEDMTMAAMSVTFYCDEEAGRVSYLTKRGVKFIQPRGTLSANIRAGGRLYVVFRKDGFAGSEGNGKYTMRLRTKDGKHEKEIAVAMYTGRVRVTRIK